MSGTGHATDWVSATGDDRIDGILHSERWSDFPLTYSFPDGPGDYGTSYGSGENIGAFLASGNVQTAARFALDAGAGTTADDGFALEGFTAIAVQQTDLENAHVRVSETTSDPFSYGTAWSYFPNWDSTAGDVWLSDVSVDYSIARAGNYAHITVLHEIGHALGLEHGHEAGAFGALPAAYDAMEYTLMTYRPYVGGPTTGYTNEAWGYAQSYMMLDIAALQHLYGANYGTHSGDTVYSWTPASGATLVDGVTAIDPGANRIFATIWDGGGTDTYDLGAYGDDLSINLAPGAASVFAAGQLAVLGRGETPSGNIYNALLHDGDTRSLIENAKGGAGNDQLRGNEADNRLVGNAGDDRLNGLTGDDRLLGKSGDDVLAGGQGADTLKGGLGDDTLSGRLGADTLRGGVGRDLGYGNRGDDLLLGLKGADRLFGGAGDDTVIGGAGRDVMTGGDGGDTFVFQASDDSPAEAARPDRIRDFTPGEDLIDLGGLVDGALRFIGTDAFSGTGGELRYDTDGDDILILADIDGDGGADFGLDLQDVTAVVAGDFLL